jgi:dihydrofolate reductase
MAMRVRTHLGVSVDGFVSTADGWPVMLSMLGFAGRESYGLPELLAECGAAVMGRTTFEPALGAPSWPWPGLEVFVLTSTPLPDEAPEGIATESDPARLLERMQEADFEGDAHLVGGPQTVRAFHDIDALDELGIVVLPLVASSGVPLSSSGIEMLRLELVSERSFPDGAVELIYSL